MAIVEIPYSPRPLQREAHNSKQRFKLLVCHRRFGKTVFAVNELIKSACTSTKENPRYAYIAPLYRQAKAVAWDMLKTFSRPIPGIKYNEAELRADFPNGARISLYGGDNPDTLRGIYLDDCVMDEYAQMSERLWPEVIRPALSDRKGGAIFIGTPMGHNAFYNMYQNVKDDDGLVRSAAQSQRDWIR
jgi:phage terminase large subunit